MTKNSIEELENLINNADEIFSSPEDRRNSRYLYENSIILAEKLNKDFYKYYAKAKINLLDKKPEDAISNLDSAIDIKSDFWEAWHYKGFAFNILDEFNESIECYNKAIEINPESKASWNNKGLEFENINDYEEAFRCYDKALEIDPGFAPTLANKAELLIELDRFEEALEYLEQNVLVNPNYSRSWYKMGSLLMKMELHDDALKFFENAEKIYPNKKYILYGKALVLMEMERFKEASEAFKKVLEIYPDHLPSLNDMGITKIKLGEYKDALKYFEKIIELNPRYKHAQSNRDMLLTLLESDEEKKAIEESELSPEEIKEKFLEIDARNAIIDSLIGKKDDIFKAKNKHKKRLNDLLKPLNPLDENFLLILRRWNSFTPAMITDLKSNYGGGYFLYWRGKGIVIDPGFDFLDNYFKNKLKLHYIDAVIITHAHIDHCNDFESILTLIFEYNEENFEDKIKKLKKRKEELIKNSKFTENDENEINEQIKELERGKKKIDVFMNMGTLKKMLSWISITGDNPNIKRIYPLEKEITHVMNEYNMKITAKEAFHNEIISTEYSVGIILELCDENNNIFKIGYTSDTQCRKSVGNQYDGVDLIITHLGSVNEDDFKKEDEKEGIKENHLMLTGVISTIYKSNADLAIVSEFGEELGEHRIAIVEALNKIFWNNNRMSKCVTGDIGLKIRIPDLAIKCYYCSEKLKKDVYVSYDGMLEDIHPEDVYRDMYSNNKTKKCVIHFCQDCENIHDYKKKEGYEDIDVLKD